MNKDNRAAQIFLICSPFVILVMTRVGIDLSTYLFPRDWSWIPSFIIYYAVIVATIRVAQKQLDVGFHWKLNFSKSGLFFNFRPFPSVLSFLTNIVLPALIPLGAYLIYGHLVPDIFWLYILVFALINPVFEEAYWRGLLSHLEGSTWFKVIYSATFFSLSHYFFWFYWLDLPFMLVVTCISTWIMGVLWMYYIVCRGNPTYSYWSHVVVDILNLSVAIFGGMVTMT